MGKNHVRIYSELPDVKLVGVADCNNEVVQSLAEKYHTVPFSDYRELLKQGLDAVSICVPTSLHKEIAIETGYAGINMLMEKPIADTVKSAKEIIEVSEKHNIKLMIGHIERFNPVVSILKKEIEDEEISLIEITRIGPFPPRINDVGVLVDLATHDIDLLRYLTNSEFKEFYSLSSRSIAKHEDTAVLLAKMENGILARITVNWLTPFKVRTISIATREKFMQASLMDQKLTEYSKYREDGSYLVKDINVPFGEPLELELKAFIECANNNTTPPVTGEDGLEALKVALCCLDEDSRKKAR